MLLVRNNDYNGHVALFMFSEDDFRLAPDWPLRSNLEVLSEGQYDRKKKTLTALGTEYVVYPDGSLKASSAEATLSPSDALAAHRQAEGN